jgi:hypothetical protein
MGRATDPVGGRFSSQAKKRLIATFIVSEIRSTRCNKRSCQFSNRNKNGLSGNFHFSAPLYPEPRRRAYLFTQSGCDGCGQSPSRLYLPDRGARMFHSLKQRSAIPGGAIQ